MRAAALAAALAVLLCCTGATATSVAASPTAVANMLRLLTTCGTQITTLKGLGAGCLLQVSRTAGENCPRVCRALTALSQRAPDPRGCVAAMLSTPAPASATTGARPEKVAADRVSKYMTLCVTKAAGR